MVHKLAAGRRAMAGAVQRYFRSRYFRDLPVPTDGALCAIDIDGVLESDRMAFPATTPAGAHALRALIVHGHRPRLVSGRALVEVRGGSRAYSRPGGVAEEGRSVYARDPVRPVPLSGEHPG